MRAFADTRLTRTHLAVLGVISRFDGFGRNGAGCYATQEKIGALAGCTSATVCKRIRDLCRWGYLKAQRQKNRRRVQYNVNHETKACPTGQVQGPAGCPTGQVPDGSTCPTGQKKGGQLVPQDKQIDLVKQLIDSGHNPRRTPSADLNQIDSPEGAHSRAVPAPPYALQGRKIYEIDEGEWWAYKSRLYRYVQDQNPLSSEAALAISNIVHEIIDADLGSREIEMAFESVTHEIQERAA